MYVDPITRQTFNYATPIECGNNPQNIIELDPDSNDGDFYVLTPEPLKREAPQMFKPTQLKQQSLLIHLHPKMPVYTQMQN